MVMFFRLREAFDVLVTNSQKILVVNHKNSACFKRICILITGDCCLLKRRTWCKTWVQRVAAKEQEKRKCRVL